MRIAANFLVISTKYLSYCSFLVFSFLFSDTNKYFSSHIVSEGCVFMVLKKVKCPQCGHILELQGTPEEEKKISCPQCHTQGVFRFPSLTAASSSTEKSVITVSHLTKQFGAFKAVDDISFEVKKGEVYGFLGPNGAGKSTTIKSILDLMHPDKGTITINGFDNRKQVKEAKNSIGYLPENVAFYGNLTAMQNLVFYAEMKKAAKNQCLPLLEEFGLGDTGKKRVNTFSKGMIQRLGMVRTILGNPSLYILDEPTNGLDAHGVVLIRKKIKELKGQGATIFISSHILSEIQAVSDRVAIIHKGKIVAQDTVDNLSEQLNIKPKVVLELEQITEKMIETVKKVAGVLDVKTIGKMMHISCQGPAKANAIVALVNAGGKIVNLHTMEPSLEEVFMRFTGEMNQ